MKLTRRQLAAALSAPALLAQNPAAPLNAAAAAQNPASPAPNAVAAAQNPPPPLPQNPDEELKAARDQNRQLSELLAKFPLPMATEPATHFKA